MSNSEHRHLDQAEIDKQQRLKEQRHAILADKFLTVVFTLLAIAVVSFLIWSHVVDKV